MSAAATEQLSVLAVYLCQTWLRCYQWDLQ